MRAPWVAAPLLLALSGCSALDPSMIYREAARQLRFGLERVEPSLHLALPIDESALQLHLLLGVDNASGTAFRTKGFRGRVLLEEGGETHPIGQLSLSRRIELPARGRGNLPVDLTLGYRDLRGAWPSVRSILRGRQGIWRVEGTLTVDVMGFGVEVPVRASKATGN